MRPSSLVSGTGILMLVASSGQATGLPAFPGAEGFGTTTVGGRGGRVHVVTNLNDAGPGSLREACEASGPRTIVVAVGGYITLESDIHIKHPFCTIAGQTASGDGVCLRGAGVVISTHDIVVRYLRFRMGYLPMEKIPHFRDCLHIAGKPPCHNIVLDHCSISWGVSRNLVTWNDAHDITVQWCIISESLKRPEGGSHYYGGMGFLVGDRTQRISVHHNLFAHNYQRNPRLKHGVTADLVNNVLYNWDDSGASLIGDFNREPDAPPVRANLINNWYQAGRNTENHVPVLNALTSATLYTTGNVSNHRWFAPDLEQAMRWISLVNTPQPAAAVTTWPAREARTRVLANVGANRPARDAVDHRIVEEVRTSAGRFVADEQDAGGWPELDPGKPRADADGDGMPDAWEIARHLDPHDPTDAWGDANGKGYTNIEEWINGMTTALPTSEPATQPAKAPSDSKIYKAGILGNCCTHGAALCRRLTNRPDTTVVAAFEKDPRRAAELAQTWGQPLAASYDAVINHPNVDFVVVTSDPCDKTALVAKAAAGGKPILLNKPLCESLDSARRIQQAVARHRVPFVYDVPMIRDLPVYARLLRDVRSGQYGAVMGYHHLFGMNFAPGFDLKGKWPERLDPPERSGGGEMTNMGCYAIDYAVALFGRPRSVTAKWRKTWDVYREADVENFGQIVLDYGAFFAFIETGKQELAGDRRHANSLTVNFEHTTLHIDASAEQVTVNHVPQDYETYIRGATARDSVDQLIEAIEDGTPPEHDLDNAVIATEVLMAAYQSIIEGATVSLRLDSGTHPLLRRN